jgi:DNA-binding response OmpR family regulator
LPRQPLKLLQYLYKNLNRVCSTEELRNVIGENYNLTYVHTLIGRIRDEIETDPGQFCYLISEPKIGYRLRTKPE